MTLSNSTEVVDENGETVASVLLPEVGSALSVTGGEKWEVDGPLAVDTFNVILYVKSLSDDGVYYVGASIFIQVI